jgi:hypothetical protein
MIEAVSFNSDSVEAHLARSQSHREQFVTAIHGDTMLRDMLVERTGAYLFNDEPDEILLERASDVLAPRKQGEARWEMLKQQQPLRQAEAEYMHYIGRVLNMEPLEPIPPAVTLTPRHAKTIIAEGGARVTSIDRRAIACKAVDNDPEATIYQLGSGRLISPLASDGTPSLEYGVVTDPKITDLAETEHITEFMVNVATALKEGWQIDWPATDELYSRGASMEEGFVMVAENRPTLVSLKPLPETHGRASLRSGIACVNEHRPLDGQLISVATSSQYIPKSTLMAVREARRLDLSDVRIQTIGDSTIRNPSIYSFELGMLLSELAAQAG